jgi:hypothetical protein
MKTSTAAAILMLISLHAGQSQATTECELLTRIMNSLGSKMSINRYIISSNNDSEATIEASKELSEQNKSYRKAKAQYKKANCKSVWDK